jgi:hypothetical protein
VFARGDGGYNESRQVHQTKQGVMTLDEELMAGLEMRYARS